MTHLPCAVCGVDFTSHVGEDAPDHPWKGIRKSYTEAKAEVDAEARNLGTRTADQLPSGPAPEMLANGWLHPEEGTILYGKGGMGKGITTVYLISLLVREGHEVLVVDFENHPREWGSRLADLSMRAEDLAHVHYASPFGREWTAKKGSVDQIADLIRDECDRLAITYVVMDSYSAASDVSADALGGQEAASKVAHAMTHIGRPYLLLAHVNGSQQKHPERPFGSVFVHNLCARRTWSVEEHEAPRKAGPDPMTMPAAVSLEYRNQKHNDTPKASDRYLVFEFFPGAMCVTEKERAEASAIDFIRKALMATPLLTQKGLLEAISAQWPDAGITADSIKKALSADRLPDDITVDKTKTPFKYGLVRNER